MNCKHPDIRYKSSESFRRKPESRGLRGRAKGFTLVELIVFIVVGAIILPASFVAFSSAIQYLSRPGFYLKARFIAEAKMEDITSRSFLELPPENATYRNVRGDITNSLSGTCFRFCTDEYDNYEWRWSIDNQSFESLDSSVCKIVTVFVRMPDGSEYDVSSIVTRRPKM